MNRPTLSTYRAQFPTEVMGVCQADPKVAAFCNESQERLMIDPLAPDEGWWGSSVTLNLTAGIVNSAAYVTTPREIARLTDLAVCQRPIHIRNRFYEYLVFGRGLQPKPCRTSGCGQTLQAYERDNVVTLAPMLSTPQKIRIYPTDTRDSGFRVLLQGKDQNGKPVTTTDPRTGRSALGEYVALRFPFVDSAYTYLGPLDGIQKDETFGEVQFFQVDATTGAEAALSSMEPHEGVANYRRYLVAGIPNNNLCCGAPGQPLQLTAQGRIDFVPVVNETDYLTVQCVPALLEESISLKYSRMDSPSAKQNSREHHAAAIGLLNGQIDAYEGKTNTAIKVPIFGSSRMRRQPV